MRASMGSVPASPALHAAAEPGQTTDLSVRRTTSFSSSYADLATALSTGMLVSGPCSLPQQNDLPLVPAYLQCCWC